ncbi:NeuD/PglB/VioB family sugar acetyltransferase [Thalassospira marina]|uniref:Sugar acetyltransferase n=1 Tax=Thalassospira marina TaxID=2048283 RepID=A0ABN5FJM7_9PROT|nr:NeuD/PglB/VioB family sugar acetyltransferase [Thalassospira marina]AUG54573.1 sugar acetyltransferase [Thalassospira marina]
MNQPNKYIIWGSAGHAKVLNDILQVRKSNIIALFDNDDSIKSALEDVPLYHGWVGFHKWRKEHPITDISAAIAIGGNSGRARLEIGKNFLALGISTPKIIHHTATIAQSACIEQGCHILAQTMISSDVIIGEFTIINNCGSVDHECTLGKGVHVAPGAVLCGCVMVGDYTMIGAGSVILPRIKIGEGAIVGAGSVVTKDVPSHTVVAGNPAKIITRK